MTRRLTITALALFILALAAAMLAGCGGDGGSTDDGTSDPQGTGKANVLVLSQPG